MRATERGRDNDDVRKHLFLLLSESCALKKYNIDRDGRKSILTKSKYQRKTIHWKKSTAKTWKKRENGHYHFNKQQQNFLLSVWSALTKLTAWISTHASQQRDSERREFVWNRRNIKLGNNESNKIARKWPDWKKKLWQHTNTFILLYSNAAIRSFVFVRHRHRFTFNPITNIDACTQLCIAN